MKRDITDLIKKLLGLTSFLEEEYLSDSEPDLYKLMLKGVSKKTYYFLYSLNRLRGDSKNGDAIIDLSRSMFENMIALAFVEEFKAETKAKKFFMFTPVELWEDTEYAIKVGVDVPQEVIEKRKREFEMVKSEFIRINPREEAEKQVEKVLEMFDQIGNPLAEEIKSTVKKNFLKSLFGDKKVEPEINKSWIGIPLEQMMVELEKRGKFPGNLKESLEKAYIFGNRKNHLSPVDIETLLDSKRHKFHQGENMSIGLFIGTLSFIKILMEFAKKNGDSKLLKELKKVEGHLLEGRGKEPDQSEEG